MHPVMVKQMKKARVVRRAASRLGSFRIRKFQMLMILSVCRLRYQHGRSPK